MTETASTFDAARQRSARRIAVALTVIALGVAVTALRLAMAQG